MKDKSYLENNSKRMREANAWRGNLYLDNSYKRLKETHKG
jgi:hypothetical protein